MDDWAYFKNNRTLRKRDGYGLDHPLMNFTKALQGNFSDAYVNCYQFAVSWYVDTRSRMKAFGSVGNYLLSFMFNQAGNAPTFKKIFTDIENDKKNQYYTDIAY